jgi:hypothetical protein
MRGKREKLALKKVWLCCGELDTALYPGARNFPRFIVVKKLRSSLNILDLALIA